MHIFLGSFCPHKSMSGLAVCSYNTELDKKSHVRHDSQILLLSSGAHVCGLNRIILCLSLFFFLTKLSTYYKGIWKDTHQSPDEEIHGARSRFQAFCTSFIFENRIRRHGLTGCATLCASEMQELSCASSENANTDFCTTRTIQK